MKTSRMPPAGFFHTELAAMGAFRRRDYRHAAFLNKHDDATHCPTRRLSSSRLIFEPEQTTRGICRNPGLCSQV